MSSELEVAIVRFQSGVAKQTNDRVAVEEPMELRIVFGPTHQRKSRTLSVTMRTPGCDFELAAGFLVSESIVTSPDDVLEIRFSGSPPEDGQHANSVEVELNPNVQFEMQKLQRHFYTTSSCGICGKTSLAAIRADNILPIESDLQIHPDLISALPEMLRREQSLFEVTGGLHAAGLVSRSGQLIALREDIGRHNAVDKLIGSRLLAAQSKASGVQNQATQTPSNSFFPLTNHLLVLSGRSSFELLQKAVLARIPIVVAVGAPSSLAVQLAQEFNLTLIGFTSEHRFNIYSGPERITL